MRRRSAAEYDTIVADLGRQYRLALQGELEAQTNVDSAVEPDDRAEAIQAGSLPSRVKQIARATNT